MEDLLLPDSREEIHALIRKSEARPESRNWCPQVNVTLVTPCACGKIHLILPCDTASALRECVR